MAIDSPLAPPTDAPTRAAVERVAQLLAGLGHHVADHDLGMPRSFKRDFEDYWSFLALGVRVGGRRLYGPAFDRNALDPLTIGLSKRAARRIPRMPIAIARLRASSRAYERSFGDVDLVLSPVVCHTTPRIGHLSADQPFDDHFSRLVEYTGFTPWHNATGAPAISVPAGQTDDGLPIGVMLSAPIGEERRLLEIAYELEESAPFPRIQDLVRR